MTLRIAWLTLIIYAFSPMAKGAVPDTAAGKQAASGKVHTGFHSGFRMGPAPLFVQANTTGYVYGLLSASQSLGMDLYFPLRFGRMLELDVANRFRYSSVNLITVMELPANMTGLSKDLHLSDRESLPLFEYQMMAIYAFKGMQASGLEMALGISFQTAAPAFGERNVEYVEVVDGKEQNHTILRWGNMSSKDELRRFDPLYAVGYRWKLPGSHSLVLRLERSLSQKSELSRSFSLPILGESWGGRQELSKRYWMLTLNAMVF